MCKSTEKTERNQYYDDDDDDDDNDDDIFQVRPPRCVEKNTSINKIQTQNKTLCIV